jgi:hypothetical protein
MVQTRRRLAVSCKVENIVLCVSDFYGEGLLGPPHIQEAEDCPQLLTKHTRNHPPHLETVISTFTSRARAIQILQNMNVLLLLLLLLLLIVNF